MFFDTNFIIMVIVCVLVHVPDLLTSIPVCHNNKIPEKPYKTEWLLVVTVFGYFIEELRQVSFTYLH